MYLRMLLGFGATVLILAAMGMCWGCGHLGAEQEQHHYLDERESMSRWPLM